MKNKGAVGYEAWSRRASGLSPGYGPKTGMVGAVEVLGHCQSTAQELFSQVYLDAQRTCLGQLTHNFPFVIALYDPAYFRITAIQKSIYYPQI